jgi:formylmethanofuran dehydrogenase subunit E
MVKLDNKCAECGETLYEGEEVRINGVLYCAECAEEIMMEEINGFND